MFCGIVAGKVPADVVRSGEHVVAFRDIKPKAPTHVLVIPKAHYENVAELAASDPEALAELVTVGEEIAAAEDGAGWRLVFNTGATAGQSVFHVHGHVLAGRRMTWPPG
jgi:histidine triad (HIT) family protein